MARPGTDKTLLFLDAQGRPNVLADVLGDCVQRLREAGSGDDDDDVLKREDAIDGISFIVDQLYEGRWLDDDDDDDDDEGDDDDDEEDE